MAASVRRADTCRGAAATVSAGWGGFGGGNARRSRAVLWLSFVALVEVFVRMQVKQTLTNGHTCKCISQKINIYHTRIKLVWSEIDTRSPCVGGQRRRRGGDRCLESAFGRAQLR